MRRKVRLGLVAVTVGALIASGLLATGGSAAPTPDRPTKQEIAQRLLQRRAQFMTPPARTYLSMIANGNRSLSQEPEESAAKAGQPQARGGCGGEPASARLRQRPRQRPPRRPPH
jgi:hypothetical protein